MDRLKRYQRNLSNKSPFVKVSNLEPIRPKVHNVMYQDPLTGFLSSMTGHNR